MEEEEKRKHVEKVQCNWRKIQRMSPGQGQNSRKSKRRRRNSEQWLKKLEKMKEKWKEK